MDGGSRKCLACKQSDETMDHMILRCTAAPCTEWRTCFWLAVDSFHESYTTHPLLRHLFREAMTQWFDTTSTDVVSPTLFPNEVRTLILTQNAIGWRQLFRGCFSQEWQRIQNGYYMKHKRKAGFKRTGEHWQQQFVKVIWDSWCQLWRMRNGEVHGTSAAATRAQAQRREVGRQLTEIYASQEFMEPAAQALLEEDQDAHATRPTHAVIQNWLSMVGPVIRRSVRRVKKTSLQGVRSLREYFPRSGDG